MFVTATKPSGGGSGADVGEGVAGGGSAGGSVGAGVGVGSGVGFDGGEVGATVGAGVGGLGGLGGLGTTPLAANSMLTILTKSRPGPMPSSIVAVSVAVPSAITMIPSPVSWTLVTSTGSPDPGGKAQLSTQGSKLMNSQVILRLVALSGLTRTKSLSIMRLPVLTSVGRDIVISETGINPGSGLCTGGVGVGSGVGVGVGSGGGVGLGPPGVGVVAPP